jgi:hypothetical protein
MLWPRRKNQAPCSLSFSRFVPAGLVIRERSSCSSPGESRPPRATFLQAQAEAPADSRTRPLVLDRTVIGVEGLATTLGRGSFQGRWDGWRLLGGGRDGFGGDRERVGIGLRGSRCLGRVTLARMDKLHLTQRSTHNGVRGRFGLIAVCTVSVSRIICRFPPYTIMVPIRWLWTSCRTDGLGFPVHPSWRLSRRALYRRLPPRVRRRHSRGWHDDAP